MNSFNVNTMASRMLLMLAIFLAGITLSLAAEVQQSGPFMGPKANTGTVTHTKQNGQHILTLSDDFQVPNTPDPHWQVVDSRGNVYLLSKLMIKGDKLNKSITLPSYISDVAIVQIWCAFAESNLGEAKFARPAT